MTNIGDLWKFDLRKGKSNSPREGACIMDAISWFEYGHIGNNPACVSPVYTAYMIEINDALKHKRRQRLKVFIPRLIGTVDPEAEQARAEYLAWQAIRVFAPFALDAAGLKKEAAELRDFNGSLLVAAARVRAARVRAPWAVGAGAEAAAFLVVRAAAEAALAAVVKAPVVAATEAALATEWTAGMAAGEALIFASIDGMLAIGKQADPIEAAMFQEAVDRFEVARQS